MIRVLLADDLLVVGEAATGPEVLRLLAERRWDLLVLDNSMSCTSVLELIKLIRQDRPHLPILVFTTHPEEQYAMRVLHAGASGYLGKDSDIDVLVAAMRKVAAGGVHVSAKVAAMLAREGMPKTDELSDARLADREFHIFE